MMFVASNPCSPPCPRRPAAPQAHLVRANPAFVRGIAGNAFSCLCIASQNLGESESESEEA